MGLAILRLDGFVSVTGSGSLTTRPLIFQGDQLSINANGIDRYAGSGYGTIKVEIQDGETGRPLPGFGAAACEVFGGDSVSHAVSWRGNSNLGPLAGKQIKLRFEIGKAKLFSFQFQQSREE